MGEFDIGDFNEFCIIHGICIMIKKNLGSTIKGFCYYDGESYHVFLNNRFSGTQLKTTTIHEIIHIMRNHFICDPKNIIKCEEEISRVIDEISQKQLFTNELMNFAENGGI